MQLSSSWLFPRPCSPSAVPLDHLQWNEIPRDLSLLHPPCTRIPQQGGVPGSLDCSLNWGLPSQNNVLFSSKGRHLRTKPCNTPYATYALSIVEWILFSVTFGCVAFAIRSEWKRGQETDKNGRAVGRGFTYNNLRRWFFDEWWPRKSDFNFDFSKFIKYERRMRSTGVRDYSELNCSEELNLHCGDLTVQSPLDCRITKNFPLHPRNSTIYQSIATCGRKSSSSSMRGASGAVLRLCAYRFESGVLWLIRTVFRPGTGLICLGGK